MIFLFDIVMNFYFMEKALKLAYKAYLENEWPVGAVIVLNNKVVSSSHNKVERNNNPLDHAEMLVIKDALKKLNTRYLDNCEMYVTLKPCSMCYAIANQVRLKKIIYGCESVSKAVNTVQVYDSCYQKSASRLLKKHISLIRNKGSAQL